MRQAILLSLVFASSSVAGADHSTASEVIEEYKASCAQEGRNLWGVSLCAPIVVVTREGQIVQASETTPSSPLPASRANTSIDWGGRKWVMVLDPLPEDSTALRRLLYHESFHTHQDGLGLPGNMVVASHLDSEMGRYWVRLEWRALERALSTDGLDRSHHIRQALAFRQQRFALSPTARDEERAQMRHEGLAEYTGVSLSGDPLRLTKDTLARANERPSFSRSFAYVNGAAWGLLLDACMPAWRSVVRDKDIDLPDILQEAPADTPDPAAYDGEVIRTEEHARAKQRQATIEHAERATSPERGLRLPLAGMDVDFDPNRVFVLQDGSSLYEKITVRSAWGSLQSAGAPVRMAKDWSAIFVPWPIPEGMTLKLKRGYSVRREVRDKPALVKKPSDHG